MKLNANAMTNFNFVELRKWWFGLSAVLILASIAALLIFGLRFSIDFVGGSLMQLGFATGAPITQEVSATLTEIGFEGVTVQSVDANQGLLIRTASLTEEQHQSALTIMRVKFGEFTELRFDSIGPVIGDELRRSALIGLITTLVLIGLYINWAFRKVSDPVESWKYGLITMACAAHDIIIPLGVFAVLGHYYHWEVGTAFIAAMLTILGYSISDTVVVFDRTRENLSHKPDESFAQTVEKSIQQTYIRSINTSVTVILALSAILVFGGDSTRAFALALLIGVLVGTYSSIFFASPALVEWELRRSSR